jgi:hypothetical protein
VVPASKPTIFSGSSPPIADVVTDAGLETANPRLWMHHARTLASALAGFAVSATSGLVTAAPLDPESCQRIKNEVQALEQIGIRDIVGRGPAAARTLQAAQLEKVKQLMGLDGQLRFRCPADRPFVTLKEEPPDDPADAAANTATLDASAPGITLPPGTTVPAAKPKQAVKSAPKPSVKAPSTTTSTIPPPASPPSAVGATPAMTTAPAAAPKPKPKPKPKVEDAYRPPATATEPAAAAPSAAPAQVKSAKPATKE